MTTQREQRKAKTRVFVRPKLVSIRGDLVRARVPRQPGNASMNMVKITARKITEADRRAGLDVGDYRWPAGALAPGGEFLDHSSWVAVQIARGNFVEEDPPREAEVEQNKIDSLKAQMLKAEAEAKERRERQNERDRHE
ncbi:MAG: hypothetical protein ACPGVG_14165 [Mycobacterium sp.]